MPADPAARSSRPRLQSLGGKEAPEKLIADLRSLLELPPNARRELWTALAPSLPDPIPPAAEGAIDDLATSHGADGRHIAIALKACRHLIRKAAGLDLSTEAFAEDLAALVPGERELGMVLLPGYEAAKALVRAELVAAALATHGSVLVDVTWRLDVIAASPEAADLRTPIAMLTVRYLEDGQRRSMTLQATPEALRKLRSACDTLLG